MGTVVPQVTTVLTDPHVDSKIHDAKSDDCIQFLSTIGQIIEDLEAPSKNDDSDSVDLLCEEYGKERAVI